ncbi:hypothetical protein BRCON_0351 [Candidatus Sumerlaea chitinivorans]|uniref:Uncharacterized protein n=1 Tax=Sumerlaea chitinivorans TaxID=2250252 RepID=A0A2Z4Y2Q5_SUMC1|nr:hypothetical protein BRCON_0351 [Candidatus Sumerlaea chitinivorans]
MRSNVLKTAFGIVSLSATAAFAQPWASNYAVGEGPVFNPAWNPSAPAYLMSNLGGNIYGITITPNGVGPGAYGLFLWKVSDGSWSNTAPANTPENAYGRAPTTASLDLRVDFNAHGDGFIPDVGVNGQNGILYTVPKVWDGAAKVILVGAFNGWNNNDTTYELKDDGVAPDATAGDGIYTGQFVFSSTGSFDFLVLPMFGSDPGSWDLKLSQRGIADGGNLNVIITDTSNPYKFTVDTNKGRIKIESPAPPITYPCALSSAWDTTPGPATQLFDDGTNGDVVSGDGIYARVFTVTNADPSGQDQVQVYDNGNMYPQTAGYPFKSVANGTKVVVSYDTNSYSDGYLPSTKIVWVNPSARLLPGDPSGPTGVHVTGDFVADLGGTNWNPGDPLTQLSDANSDQIYDITFPGSIVPAMSGKQWKATGGSWTWQYGSPDNGFTKNGNNPNMSLSTSAGVDLQFKVDAVNGRAGYGQPSIVDPTRPSNAVFNNSSSVADWQLF